LPSLLYTNTPKTDNFDYTGYERLKTFNLGYIDAGARWMDPLVPRFITIDPLAEISRKFSPTTYANNNPIRFIDPDGMRTQSIEQSNLEWGFSTLTHCDGCEFLGGGDKPKKKSSDAMVAPLAMTATMAEGGAAAASIPVAGQIAAAGVGGFVIGKNVLAPNTEGIAEKLGEILLALGVPRAWLMATKKPTDLPVTVPITTTIESEKPGLKIALGVESLLPGFSSFIGAVPYYDGWAKTSDDIPTVLGAIYTLGQIPGTTFHFNLSTDIKDSFINDPINLSKVFSKSHTSAEFRFIMAVFPDKVTFYKKYGNEYKKVNLTK
jgi:RHS repeat-associated protein